MTGRTERGFTSKRARWQMGSRAAALLLAIALLTGALAPGVMAQRQAVNVVPLTITSVVVQNGQLVANGLLGSHPFTAPITTTASPNALDPTCPILHLQLGPIHLNLLGIVVDTSQICLDITATPGAGNLLGNLLCGISNALNGGTPLSTVLGALTAEQLSALNTGLTSLLNTVVFVPLTASTALASATCPVLNLTLAPVTLNLLGLNVKLDNCAGGPVTLAVTAQQGTLLGGLVCALANALNGGAAPIAISQLLAQISQLLHRLLG
jgi:hypothetical protein